MNLLTLFIRRSTWLAAIAITGAIASGLLASALAVLVNQMLQSPGQPSHALMITFALLCAARLGAGIASQSLLVRISQRALHKLRLELCHRILSAPLRDLERLGTSQLLSVFTDDLSQIATAFINLPYALVNLIIIAGCLAYIGWLCLPLLAVLSLMIAAGGCLYAITTNHANRLLTDARHTNAILLNEFRQLLGGIRELKLNLARQRDFLQNHLVPSANLLRRQNTAGITLYSAAANFSRLLFFIYVGLLLTTHGTEARTTLAGCVLLLLYMMAPLEALLNALPVLAQANIAVSHLRDIQSQLGIEPAVDSHKIPFRQLTFTKIHHLYDEPGNTAPFETGPITLTLRPGEITFIAGTNGSGKTTLSKLITGLYTPHDGTVTLNDDLLTPCRRQQSRALFSALFADFHLFDELLGIPRENLHNARHYLHLLDLQNKVSLHEGRLSTLDLSQGQRKRLALLTTLLEDRPIVLFDEWASDQDPQFKQFFYRTIVPSLAAAGKAVVVITHDDRYFDIADHLINLEAPRSNPAPAASGLVALANRRPRPLPTTESILSALLITIAILSAPSFVHAQTSPPAQACDAIACLQKSASILQTPINMLELLTKAFPDPTTAQIVAMAESQHLHATRMQHIAIDQIRSCPFPLILHVYGGRYSKAPDTYVLAIGMAGNQLKIFNPPSTELTIPLHQLEPDRMGQAIIISVQPIPPDAPFLHHAIPWKTYTLMILTTAALIAPLKLKRPKQGGIATHNSRSALNKSVTQAATVLFSSCVLANVVSLSSGLAPGATANLPSPDPIDFLISRAPPQSQATHPVTEISLQGALAAVGTSALFVDARDPADFVIAHIKGAISCPASAIQQWPLDLAGVEFNRRLIVYCAEAACHKGQYVADYLARAGFTDVSLYRDGWARWTGPREEEGEEK